MKLRLLGVVSGLLIATGMQAVTIKVKNQTNYTARVVGLGRVAGSTLYQYNVKPGEVRDFDIGGYLMDTLWATMLVPATEPTAADRVNLTVEQLANKYKATEMGVTEMYTSSGQSAYRQFVITGDQWSGFRTGRFIS